MEYEQINKTVTNLSEFYINYAKSEESTCNGCQKKINEHEIQIMKTIDEKAAWYHVVCFARARSQLGWPHSVQLLPGFNKLSHCAKQTIKDQIM